MGAQPQLHGPAYEWALWSTTMRVVTADPHALPRRAGWSTPSSPASSWPPAGSAATPRSRTCPPGRRVHVSGTLTAILAAALQAAHDTDGVLDPTVSRPLQPVDESAAVARHRPGRAGPYRSRPPRRRAGPGTGRPGLGRRPVCGRGRRDARRRASWSASAATSPRRVRPAAGRGRSSCRTAPTTRRPSSPSPPDWPWSPRPPPRVARTARPAWSPLTASPRRRGRSPPSPRPGRESSVSRSAAFPPASSLPRAPSVTWAAGPTMPRWSRLARMSSVKTLFRPRLGYAEVV